MATVCLAPGCGEPLPKYVGIGRPRRWCSMGCRRTAEVMAGWYRSGTLGVRADEGRSLGYPQHAARMDEWRRLFDDFTSSDNERATSTRSANPSS